MRNIILSVIYIILIMLIYSCGKRPLPENGKTIIVNYTNIDIPKGEIEVEFDNSKKFILVDQDIASNNFITIIDVGEKITSLKLNINLDSSFIDISFDTKKLVNYKNQKIEFEINELDENPKIRILTIKAVAPPPKLKNIVFMNHSLTPLSSSDIKITYDNGDEEYLSSKIDSVNVGKIDKKGRKAYSVSFKDLSGNYKLIVPGTQDTVVNIALGKNLYVIVSLISNDIYRITIKDAIVGNNKNLKQFVIINSTGYSFTLNDFEYKDIPVGRTSRTQRFPSFICEQNGISNVEIGLLPNGEGAEIVMYSIGLENGAEFSASLTPIVEANTSSIGNHVIGVEISNSKNCTFQ